MRFSISLLLPLLAACAAGKPAPEGKATRFDGENRFASVRPLLHGGTSAEAYWSFDGKRLSFQHKGKWRDRAEPGLSAPACDQIYTVARDGSELRSISKDRGRTTCSFYTPNSDRVLYSSTVSAGPECPTAPDWSKGYVWPIYDSFQIYSAKTDGSDPIQAEPGAPKSYNAETTLCHDGSVIFTSDRSGDLELYRATLDPLGTFKDVQKITDFPGYDGGAFFSPDCKKIVWRASRPKNAAELKEYRGLLKQHLVKPGELELWIADADGKHARQLTKLGVASFAPSFSPDGRKIIFSSNLREPGGRHFELFMIDVNGTNLEQVTRSGSFDSFPMFSPDGKWLAFSSNRDGLEARETSVYLAEWNADAHGKLDPPSSADRFFSWVEKLSAPEMQGRGMGSAGLAVAEKAVAAEFEAIGLKPFLADSFLQEAPSRKTTTHNVVGSFGSCKNTQPVVIGAHLDHLGMGDGNSLEPNQKGIHPGADDNASGVSAVLEIARTLSSDSRLAKRCFIFAAFTGEETGIIGSSALAEKLRKARIRVKAMLNLDMVGRLERNALLAFGSDSAPEWKKILEEECQASGLRCSGGGDGYGPSDHMAFYIQHAPVLHFFTGPHLDYHRSSDTAEKINATGGAQVAAMISRVAARAADPKTSLHYRKAQASQMMGALKDPAHGGLGNKAYLGTIPDYSSLASPHGPGGGGEEGGGVKLAGTRPGSPADKAGVKEGDVLLAIGEKKIATLEGFTQVLTGLKPGDEVTLKVRRGDRVLDLPATVGKRQ